LLIVFVGLIGYEIGLVHLGASLSGFQGAIGWEGTEITALSDSWSRNQVLWIYLFPYLGILIAYIAFSFRRHPRKVKSKAIQLLWTWAYLLTMVWVFFMPLCNIYNRQGIHYALNWLHISIQVQYLIGIMFWVLFLLRMFRLAPLFSMCLHVPHNPISHQQITRQLPALIYIPFLFLSTLLLIINNLQIPTTQIAYLTGILLLLLPNSLLLRRYDVILK
jgi:hypothetical protein